MEQTAAILVRKTLFSETTLLCTWISEKWGKVKTSARGAKKIRSSFQGRLDLFHEVEICFERSRASDLHFLRESDVKLSFTPSELPYSNLALAAYFAELSDAVLPAPDAPAPEVFDLLKRGLRYLRKSPASLRALTHFESSLCSALGVGGTPLATLEYYCGQLPHTRTIALQAFALCREIPVK